MLRTVNEQQETDRVELARGEIAISNASPTKDDEYSDVNDEDIDLEVESTDFEASDVEVVDCAKIESNHEWEEFAGPTWVKRGGLLYEKHCIGTRNGVTCERKFVCVLLKPKEDKSNCTETEYRPTRGHPAWGCRKCKRAMCNPCKMYYVANEKLKSPGRNSGVGNDRAGRR
jgi:hypothetical protein